MTLGIFRVFLPEFHCAILTCHMSDNQFVRKAEDAMTTKFFGAICLVLGLLVSTNVAWSAKWSRDACINAVNQKLGSYSTDRGISTNKDAVRRCMKHGPGAID
jgi:hypothetical protein